MINEELISALYRHARAGTLNQLVPMLPAPIDRADQAIMDNIIMFSAKANMAEAMAEITVDQSFAREMIRDALTHRTLMAASIRDYLTRRKAHNEGGEDASQTALH